MKFIRFEYPNKEKVLIKINATFFIEIYDESACG